MNTQLTQSKPKLSALNLMASKFSVEPDKLLGTLKATVFKNATNEELLALVVVANTYGLNPLTKEIYAFPAKGGGIAPIVSIDGWIRMTNDHPQFDGMDLTVDFEDGKPFSATCAIYRKDRSRPTTITEYFSECFRATEPWKVAPARMLRHKALIQAARVAFGFSGVYDEDEGKEVAMRNVTPANPEPTPTAKLANPYADPEPEPTPQSTDEPPLESPVEVSEQTERADLIADIQETCREQEITLATFGGKVKNFGLMQAKDTMRDVDIAVLRKVHDARLAIACGTYQPEVKP